MASFLDYDARYDQTDEFLIIWRNLFENEEVDFQGEHLNIKGGQLLYPSVQEPYPPLYLGSSPAESYGCCS